MIRTVVNAMLHQIFYYQYWFPWWSHWRMWEVAELWRMFSLVDPRPDRGSR